MGSLEINSFLTHLAVKEQVSASTQNQALATLLFLYKSVLEIDPGDLDGVVRACRPKRLPVVLSVMEVRAVLQQLGEDLRTIVVRDHGVENLCARLIREMQA